jgi:transcriptional regulator with XRE-family HTH domain
MTAKISSRAQRWITVIDGQRLRQLRQQRGLGQEELARLAHVSRTTVARLERRRAANCRTWTLARIAAALGEQFATLAASTASSRRRRSDAVRGDLVGGVRGCRERSARATARESETRLVKIDSGVQQRAGVAWCRVLEEGLEACGYLPVAVHGH